MSETVTIAAIEEARGIIAGAVLRTPTLPSRPLSTATGARVFVKYENLQATGSFKERGALIRLSKLTEPERGRGVIAMSAGNHAQAVALHAARLGVPATIVMPQTTPFVKVAATRAHGACVVIAGETLEEARQRMDQIRAGEGQILVHPYDDPAVIAGQGTIAAEMLADAPDLDALIVPVGGGGLIAGIALGAKAIRPEIEIIGVEAALYPALYNIRHGATAPCGGATLAEGIAVARIGEACKPLISRHVDDVVRVEESHLERAVNLYLTAQKTIAEGAGAAGLAALIADPERFRGRKVGLVLCGGNIDPRILASIMVRELEREGRIVSFRIAIPDRPGILGHIATLLGREGANILEVSHRRLFLDTPAKGTKLDVTMEVADQAHALRIVAALAAEGLTANRIEAGAGDLM